MKIKYFIILIFLIIASAQGAIATADIQYPVKELGNCKNETDCRFYCDKPANSTACLDFALKNNLMSEEEVSQAKKFLKASDKGPGGCKNKNECEEYCNNINNIDECISFAEKNDLIPPEELQEAKKVQSAIKRGVKPPPCGNKKQCDIYCENLEHMEECINFGTEAGFIQGKELEDAQKMLWAIKRGVKPPPCKGKEACDEYCSNPDNMELCMNFAMEAGFMSEEEKADSQKMLQAIKKGVKPPPCKGKKECDDYCSSEEHFQECMNFAVAAGFMSEEDAKMARKTGGKSPGNCKGKEECETFCNNPDNQETCFNFAKEHGLIPEEDLKKMEEGKKQFRQSFEQMPQGALDCLRTEIGADMFEKIRSGSVMPPREIGDKMAGCFEKIGPPQGPPNGQQQGPEKFLLPEGQTGPGGCKTPEECQSYCENNPEDCQEFQPPSMPQGPPCEGENCQQYGQPEYQEKYQEQYQEQYKQQEQEQKQKFQQQQEFQPQQQQPPQKFQTQPPPTENSPPPPPPPSAFFKSEEFLGALLYPIAKALYNVR